MEKRPQTPGLDMEGDLICVDWLTVTFHDVTPDFIKSLLGLDTPDIPWRDELLFRNGYPRQISFNNIAIRYGCDDAANFKNDIDKTAEQKVRFDMGIQLDMSGNGCRAFGTYGHGDMMKLLHDIVTLDTKTNITRIDLAYDERTGILPLRRIADDTLERFYTGSPKKSEVLESDNQLNDLRALTVYVGSRKSMIFMRIYDKAKEREDTTGKHWIRVELELRHDRANAAVREILNRNDVGLVLCGILRGYCMYREETNDSNKSRWPIAPYWEKLLGEAEKIKLFTPVGEEYNFKKSEESLIYQYGQVIQVIAQLSGSLDELLRQSKIAHPELKPKYKIWMEEEKARIALEHYKLKKLREELCLSYDENFPILDDQMDMAEIFLANDNPGAAGPRYKIPE